MIAKFYLRPRSSADMERSASRIYLQRGAMDERHSEGNDEKEDWRKRREKQKTLGKVGRQGVTRNGERDLE